MPNSQRISFTFPGLPEVITIRFDYQVGQSNNPKNPFDFSYADPELISALRSVDGLDMSSIWTKVKRRAITTAMVDEHDRDDIIGDIAIALSKYFGTAVEIGDIVDNRS